MPCNDGGYSAHYEDYRKAQKERDWFESALCATMTALEDLMKQNGCAHAYDILDYKEAGIRRGDLIIWHEAHKIKDAKRREREAQERQEAIEKAKKAKAKTALLAKLTPEERELLGV